MLGFLFFVFKLKFERYDHFDADFSIGTILVIEIDK